MLDATPAPFDTPAGRIVGTVDGDVVRALGIPYARADRFAPPEPMPPFASELHASTPSPVAPQPHAQFVDQLLGEVEDITVDEHCQRLSITLPADVTPDERLPVMVWIHGGSYVIGGGDLPIYDARDLVTEQRVIVVSVTFRLGVLGFLGDGASIPANLGLLDLLESLRWVQANIAAFGGDPDLVTVFGQSAGGDAAAHLMISDGAAGLFRRAIIQSAPLGLSRGRSRMNRAMIRAVGAVHADTPLDDLLERQALGTRAAAPYGLAGGMPFGTQYGFAPLPAERDLDDAWSRVAPDVDVLIGSATDETGMYVPLVRGLSRVARSRILRPALRWWVVRPLSDVIYGRDVRRFTARHRRAGGRATSYRLLRGVTTAPTGAVHMSDLPLLLGGREAWAGTRFVPERDWPEVERRGRAFRAIWAEFARTGAVTAPDDETLTFDQY
ncbi:para-nitrobenzyl esterase [Curtobacterium sp. PhB142]|uniref:carboxylesterase family protein n=1 Tax=unclassified Curtobacterium TaxID=257496 RepID=UPI0010475B42|nr:MULTISPECIES: carboxylesterase family protein [unclassified Curtobacterium]TCL88550.1 para-nitrobenzyl esterase [Curtobacterium sp. PhB142]TCM04087.1 para-nitrobenzyl esterase [Curtobacterium sp. PhB134]